MERDGLDDLSNKQTKINTEITAALSGGWLGLMAAESRSVNWVSSQVLRALREGFLGLHTQ